MNARQIKAENAAKAALVAFLGSTASTPDPVSLSRSYGLPQPIVERMIREVPHDRG